MSNVTFVTKNGFFFSLDPKITISVGRAHLSNDLWYLLFWNIYFLSTQQRSIKWERPNAENRENETIERKRDEETEINKRTNDNKQTENGNESISKRYLKRLAVTKKNQDCLRFLKGTEEYFETLQYSETRTYYTYHNMILFHYWRFY